MRQVRFCELVVGAFFTLSYCGAGTPILFCRKVGVRRVRGNKPVRVNTDTLGRLSWTDGARLVWVYD